MKRSIRYVAMTVALALMLAPAASMGRAEAERRNTITVGTLTPLSGEFYLSVWGNSTSDIDVRRLLHGYGTIIGQSTMDRRFNPAAVEAMTVTKGEAGSKIYTFRLKSGLKFSDGSAIEAKHYVATLLMSYLPQLRAVGATIEPMSAIVGGTEFQSGKRTELSGVRLLDELSFSVALLGKALPDFNELRYVDLFPTPIESALPGTDLADEGKGVYLKGKWDETSLREALRGDQGYCSHPNVVSGPYRLESFDARTGEAHLVRNGYYQAARPAIEDIRFISLGNDEVEEALKTGRVQLVNKLLSKSVLESLSGVQGLLTQRYPREGMAYLAFNYDNEVVRSLDVRKAVARSLDRQAIVSQFYGDNGLVVDGYYGAGQWMTLRREALGLDMPKGYEYDLKEASLALNRAGYTQNKPLALSLLIPEGNAVAEAVAAQLEASFEQLGAQLSVERRPWVEVLSQYYRQSSRQCDMIFMASNFSAYFEPTQQFATGEAYQGTLNQMGVSIRRLYERADRMRAVSPDAPLTYFDRWQEFQAEFMRQLPLVPLYSNYYTDVFSENLQGYDIAAHASWADAILDASYQPE